MIQPGVYNHTIQRRADYELPLEFLDGNRSVIDFTGWGAVAQIWDAARSIKYADFEVVFTDRLNGKVALKLSAANTTLLPKSAYWDLMFINSSNERAYWLEGTVVVSEGYSEP